MSNVQVLENLNLKKGWWLSIELKVILLRLCTPFTKHNLKSNLLILQNSKRWLAASVRLPEEELVRVKWWGRTARSDWGVKRKAAVCWHLVTASHYCTDAMKYEWGWPHVPIQRHRNPTRRFKAAARLPRRFPLSLFWGLWRLTGTRPMFADQRTAGRSAGQTATLASGEKLVPHLQHYLHFQPFLMQATC